MAVQEVQAPVVPWGLSWLPKRIKEGEKDQIRRLLSVVKDIWVPGLLDSTQLDRVEAVVNDAWPWRWESKPGLFERDGVSPERLARAMDDYLLLLRRLRYIQLKPARFVAKTISGLDHVQKVLDVGTGTGFTLAEVARLHPNACFIGIEPNQQFLDLAPQFLGEVENARVRLGNGLRPNDFPEVDVVFATNVTHLFNPGRLVRFYRIALAKARLAVITSDAKHTWYSPYLAPVLGSLIGIGLDFNRDGALTMRKAHMEEALRLAIELANADGAFGRIAIETNEMKGPLPAFAVVIRKLPTL